MPHPPARQGQTDPTRTKTLRRTYAQRLRGAFARINTEIRRGVRDRDVLGLGDGDDGEQLNIIADVSELPDLATLSPAEQMERFEAWLESAMESEVMAVIERDDNRFVRRAYERGLKDGKTRLRQAGLGVDDIPDIGTSFRLAVHEETLQALFARNYSELQGITDKVSQQVTRVLADGIGEGVGPDEMASRITDRVDSIGKTRATVMARPETINTYTQAWLNRYERAGVEQVGAQVEFLTAGDSRVCPQCRALAGDTFSIDEARGKIPVHPQCRCTWIPVVGEAAAAAYTQHPTAFQTLFAAGTFAGPTGQQRYEALATASASTATQLVAQAG